MLGRMRHYVRTRTLNGVARLAGVDQVQLNALTLAFTRDLFRNVSRFRFGERKTRRPKRRSRYAGARLMVGVYFFLGLVMAQGFLYESPNTTFIALGITSTLFVMLGLSLLVESQNSLLNQTDFDVVAPRPIDSQTFFVAKLCSVCTFGLILTGCIGLPTLIGLWVHDGWLVGLSWLSTLVTACLFVSCGSFCLFTSLYKALDAKRLSIVSAVIQVGAIVLLMVVVLAVTYDMQSQTLHSFFDISDNPFALLLPPVWFASPVVLAKGVASYTVTAGVLASTGSLGLLWVWILRLRQVDLFVELGEIRGRARHSTPPRRLDKRRHIWVGWLQFSNEFRVLLRMFVKHVTYDPFVRNQVLGLLPVILVFFAMPFVMGVSIVDPFELGEATPGFGFLFAVHMAMFWLALLGLDLLRYSQNFNAAWIFGTAPLNRGKLTAAVANVATVLLVLPSVVLFLLITALQFERLSHALIHSGMMTLLLLFTVQLRLFAGPILPFSKALRGTTAVVRPLLWLGLGGILVNGIFFVMVFTVYGNDTALTTTAAIIATLTFLTNRFANRLNRSRTRLLKDIEG